jgi:hypothetical protein
MPCQWERTVLFFCIFCIGLGGWAGDPVEAEFDWFNLNIPNVSKNVNTLKREISGYVTHNGNGLSDVGIYEGNLLLGVTDERGYYSVKTLVGIISTIAPKLAGYQFTPPYILIPGDDLDHSDQNFTAQKSLSISGTVTWKNYAGFVTIPINPLPQVAMEARREDGSLYSSVFTGTDGKYSISVPTGWTGSITPVRYGFYFFPEKMPFYYLTSDQTQNFQAPHTIYPAFRVTVWIKKQGGGLLPLSENVEIDFIGTNHASGSLDLTLIDRNTGKAVWDLHRGWIGTVMPINQNYNFTPEFIQLSGPITSTMEFTFYGAHK